MLGRGSDQGEGAGARQRLRTNKRAVVLSWVTFLGLLVLTARPAGAGETRYEAEDFSHGASCWAIESEAEASNGAHRSCQSPNVSLSFSATIVAGERGTVSLIGYRTTTTVEGRWRANGGPWESFSVAGGNPTQTHLNYGHTWATTGMLSAGSYSFDVQFVSGLAPLELDYGYVLTEADPSATTTTTAAPSTTTTSTTVPPWQGSDVCGTEPDEACHFVVRSVEDQAYAALFAVCGLTGGVVCGQYLFGGGRD